MKMFGKVSLGIALFAVAVVLFSGGSAQAATFTVATGNDENTDNASCALSEAIENINDGATTNTDCSPTGAYGTDDTINLPTGTITLTADLTEIANSVIIQGQSKADSIIDGDSNTYTAFLIGQTAGVTNAAFRDFSITGAEEVGIAVCAADVTMDNISVSDSGAGAVVACTTPGHTVLSVEITDSEFNDNVSEGIGSYDVNSAGLFVQPYLSSDSCTGSLDVNIARVRANNNSQGQLVSGLGVWGSAGSCSGAVSLEDVESNRNTGSYAAGINLFFEGSVSSNLDRITAADNSLVGTLASLILFPVAGVSVYAGPISVSNASIYGNMASPDGGSDVAFAGIMLLALNGSPDIDITNMTLTNNHLTNSSNLSNLGFSGAGTASVATGDFTTFSSATITNLLAANNTIDEAPATCQESVDFGSGPIELAVISGGGNVIEDGTCAFGLDDPSDQNNVTGLFATLAAPAYNDGFVQTVALLEGSPAIDAGVAVPFSLDAQQVSRSQGAAVDAGAYESAFTRAVNEASTDDTSTLAESGTTIIGLVILSTAILIGAVAVSRRRIGQFRLPV